ncbi:MAG: hypothetical protein ACREE4_20980 [Stellaceae bacterium]
MAVTTSGETETLTGAVTTMGPRRLAVLIHLARGHTEKETASAMEAELNTVKAHRKKLYLSLGLEGQRQVQARLLRALVGETSDADILRALGVRVAGRSRAGN